MPSDTGEAGDDDRLDHRTDLAYHGCVHAVVAQLALAVPVRRLWMSRTAVDGRFGGCVGKAVRTDPVNLVFIALAGVTGESPFSGEPVDRLLRRCTVDMRVARTALAACDDDLTIDEALHDCRRLCVSWFPEITRLVPHLLTAPDGWLSGREIEAILSAEDRR